MASGGSQTPWTHNVIYGLAATGFYGVGGGLYQMTVLPSFILAVGGSNFTVGFAEGLQGVANMVSALPAGYLADKCSRRACIRLGGGLQLLSGVCLLASVGLAVPGSMHAYVLLCLSLCLQGICDGIMNGPLVALMDDSCPAGRRSDVETANAVMYGSAASVGPLIGLIVFLYSGNAWTLPSMKLVISVGVVLGSMAIFPAWRMDDKLALGDCSEAVHLQESLQPDALNSNPEGRGREVALRGTQSSCFGLVNTSRVRVVLFMGEVIMCLGAGMTVKFFPIFFDQDCHLNPATLQAAFASLSGLTVIGTLVANKLAKRIGRLQVIIPSFVIGITCTMLLGLLKPFYTIPAVMLPIFMLRCSIQWSCGALMGSVIADYTPKAQRGRWKALGSITAMGWSGSAAVGGWLIDNFGYGPTFVITGCFQAAVIPMWCLLLPLVAKESELLAAIGEDSPGRSASGISLPNGCPQHAACTLDESGC